MVDIERLTCPYRDKEYPGDLDCVPGENGCMMGFTLQQIDAGNLCSIPECYLDKIKNEKKE